jgi:hypothetical protein
MSLFFVQQLESIVYEHVIFYDDCLLLALQFLVSLDLHIQGPRKQCQVYPGWGNIRASPFLT